MPALAACRRRGHMKEVRSVPDVDARGAVLPSPAGTRPMLARLARELPHGDFCYEPKWDGLRALAFVAGAQPGATVDIRSRHGRPLARYFPEIVAALAALAHASRGPGRAPPAGGGAG